MNIFQRIREYRNQASDRRKLKEETIQRIQETTAKYVKRKQMINDFAELIASGFPPIPDAKMLPYPRPEIRAALLEEEQEICDEANELVASGERAKASALEPKLVALRTCRTALYTFAEIEDLDRSRVDHFNSFEDASLIPKGESIEFRKLHLKYAEKGFNEQGLSFDINLNKAFHKT